MPTMDTQTWIMIAGVVVLLIALAALIIYKKKQSHNMANTRLDPCSVDTF